MKTFKIFDVIEKQKCEINANVNENSFADYTYSGAKIHKNNIVLWDVVDLKISHDGIFTSEVSDVKGFLFNFEKVTYTPEDWGNLYFPTGCASVGEVMEDLDDNCSNGHFSRWTNHGNNCYIIAKEQLS